MSSLPTQNLNGSRTRTLTMSRISQSIVKLISLLQFSFVFAMRFIYDSKDIRFCTILLNFTAFMGHNYPTPPVFDILHRLSYLRSG